MTPRGADSTPERRVSTLLMLTAIIALAFSLRPAVNSVGAVLPQIRLELALSATSAGLLNALPAIVFAFGGIIAPAIAARVGAHRLVVLALIVAVTGQLLRARVDGTYALFAGTLLTLTGLSAGNVLLPGLIRQHFPDRITTITSLYITVLSLGATVGSGLTIPLQNSLDGSWRTGLSIWAILCLLAIIPWLLVLRGTGRRVRNRISSSVPLKSLLRSGLAWTMAGFFALQGAQVYVAIGWLGQILLEAGIDQIQMGTLLALGPALGIVLSLVTPNLLRGATNIRWIMTILAGSFLVGYLGLLTSPADGAWVWMFFIGLGGGTFPTVLTLIALRAATPDGVIALSAFTQCLGYLLAAVAPLVFGLLHDLADSWQPSLIMMAVTLIPMLILGLRLARPVHIEDRLS